MNALNDLVREGKVRYLGASNLTGWQLQRNADLTRERGWHPLISLQVSLKAKRGANHHTDY